jgi:tetratricopeptide (TPR) repeat protein
MPAQLPKLEGHFDGIANNHAQGWLYSPDAPRTRLEVELVCEDKVVARGIANGLRQALLDAGIGDGKHGFSIPLPASICDGNPHSLVIREAYTGQVLAGGSRSFHASAPTEVGVPAAQPVADPGATGVAVAATGPTSESQPVPQGAFAQGAATADTARTPPYRLQGSFDGVDQGRAVGWVFSPDVPRTRFEVEILCGDRPVARGVADVVRDDLAKTGLGDGRYGFDLPIDRTLCVGATPQLRAREAYSGQLLDGGPHGLPEAPTGLPRPATAALTIEGHFDDVVDGRAEGWAFSPQHPDCRAQIEILCEERVVARGPADRLRVDLRDGGIGDGRCAFSLALDPALFDGSAHRLSAREVSTRQILDGSPRLVELLASGESPTVETSAASADGELAPLPSTSALPAVEAASGPTSISTPSPGEGQHLQGESGSVASAAAATAAMPQPGGEDRSQPAASPAQEQAGELHAPPGHAKLQGNLEAVRGGRLEGWVFDPSDPLRRLEVEIRCDGVPQGRCAADLHRPDLVEAGIGDGRHAFSFPLSPDLLDGVARHMTVHEVASGEALHGSPLELGSSRPEPADDPSRTSAMASAPEALSETALEPTFDAESETAPAPPSVGEPVAPTQAAIETTAIEDGPADETSLAPTPVPASPESAAEPVSVPEVSGLQGRFEGVVNGEACGWVLDPLRPEMRIDVEVLCDGKLLGRTHADLEREDLIEATLGDGRHGFRFTLDNTLFDGQAHELSVRAAGAQLPLPGGPQWLQSDAPPARVRPANVQGAFELVEGSRATGHVWDVSRPDFRLEVEILHEGEVVSRALANTFRRDLYDAGIGDGRHAFSAQLSYELFDGAPHWLTAREVHTGKALTHGPHLFEHAKASWPYDLMSRAEGRKHLEALLADPVVIARGVDADRCRRQFVDGCLRQEMRQTETARAIYLALIEQLGENALCHCKLAETHLLDGEPDAALDEYRRASSLPPPLHWSYLGIGNAFKAREQFVDAEDAYHSALRLAPREPMTLARLQEVAARAVPIRVERLVADGKLDEAIRLLKARLIESPENPMILSKLDALLARRDGVQTPAGSGEHDAIAAFDASLRVLDLLLADDDAAQRGKDR